MSVINHARLTKLVRMRLPPPPHNTIPPDITGSPLVGQSLTMSTGTWENVTGLTAHRVWTKDGLDIPGTLDLVSRLNIDTDANSVISGRVFYTDPRGAIQAFCNQVTVRVVLSIAGVPSSPADVGSSYLFAPVVAGGTPPYAFTSVGAALMAGTSLSGTTGTLAGTLTTAATYAGIKIRVTDNAGQTADLNLPPIVVEAVVIPDPGASVIYDNGEGIHLRSAAVNGKFISDQVWIDTSAADVAVSGFDTPSADVLSADFYTPVYDPVTRITTNTLISGQSYKAHGAMWCPCFIPYTGEGGQALPLPPGITSKQGMSERFSIVGAPVSNPTANTSGNAGVCGYDDSLNIDPANQSRDFIIPRHTTGTLFKMVDQLDGPFGMRDIGANRWRRAAKYCIYHFVDGPPPADALAPGISLAENDPERENWLRMSDADKSSLGTGFTLPTSWNSKAFDPNNLMWQPFLGQFGEFLRMWVICPTVPDDTGSNFGQGSGYSRDYGLKQCQHLYQLLAQGPSANQTEWIKVLQIGAQLWSLVYRGHTGIDGAGQAAGYKPQLLFMLFAFHAVRPDMVEPCLQFRANYTNQQFWPNASILGMDVNKNGNHNANMSTFMTSHLPQVFFAHTLGMVRDEAVTPRSDGTMDAVRDTDYEIGSAGQTNSPEFIVSAGLRNGPGGMTGAQFIAQMMSWDPQSPTFAADRTERSASLAYVYTYRSMAGPSNISGGLKSLDLLADSPEAVLATIWRDAMDISAPGWGFVPFVTVPDACSPSYNKTNIDSGSATGEKVLAAGSVAGSIKWDIRNIGFRTLPVEDALVEYSIDEVQFIPVSGIADPTLLHGQQNGLTPGKAHSVRWRRSSIYKGVKTYGPWSVNYKRLEKTTDQKRMIVPTTGSTTATPTFAVQPLLHYRPYPRWWYPYCEPLVTSPFDQRIAELWIGSGYPTGLTGTLNYTMQRKVGAADWVDIDGSITQNYFWTFQDMSNDGSVKLRGRVLTTNGAVAAYTNELTIPSITESALLELFMDVPPPAGLMTALQTYIENLRSSPQGDLYALHDMIHIPLHTAQASLLNLKTPGGTAWNGVMSGQQDSTGVFLGKMVEEDFTPFVGFQGDGLYKWLNFNFPDTPISKTNWSLSKCSLIAKVTNTLNHNSNVSVLGGAGSNTLLIPNTSGNVRARAHSNSNLSSPSSGGSRLGWSATIREDDTGHYNARGTVIGVKSPLPSPGPPPINQNVVGTGSLGALKGGNGVYCPDLGRCYAIGAVNRAQYLSFISITDAFLTVLDTFR